ncbi:CBN-PQN-96 protein [Caenorhabditis brenneri]|uniref:CBN-PQN-96 protein n=1 Tax=Caenorhabditis brenneri TaxID=135651 RepID=G0MDY2_CAEBE|nr:CBN-PQN-96 protein [Caenorhabditis brenneri]
MPQQPSPPIMGAGAAPGAPQQPYGQQTQFQPQYQPYPQQQTQQQQPQQFQPQQFQPGQPQQFQPQQQAPPQPAHPDRESYQTALPPTVTPGWNDPPPILSTSGATVNRLSNMRRRPVDPSITGTGGGYGAAPQTANPYGGAAYGAQQQDPQQQYQQQQYQAYQQQQQNHQQYGQQYPGAPQQQQHYGNY